MNRTWGVVLIIGMFLLSLLFLSWSGLLRFQSPMGASAFPHLQSLVLSRQGNRQLEAQNYQGAFETYVKILEFDPFSAETHLNLGLSFEGQQQAEKAKPSYQNALQYAKDRAMKFMAVFNLAQLLGKEKKVDEALELYQKALELEPASKEVKTNIELLIQSQQQQQSGQGGDDKKEQDQKDSKDEKNQKDQKNQKDPKDPKNQKDQKDQKDSKGDQGKDPKDKQQDPKDQGKNDPEKKDKSQNPHYAPNQKHQPRQFKGQELSEGDVKKILGEIKQQEQRIRSEYNRKEVKEQPRDKDW